MSDETNDKKENGTLQELVKPDLRSLSLFFGGSALINDNPDDVRMNEGSESTKLPTGYCIYINCKPAYITVNLEVFLLLVSPL